MNTTNIIDHAIESARSFSTTHRPYYRINHIKAEIELLEMHMREMRTLEDIERCRRTISYWKERLINFTQVF